MKRRYRRYFVMLELEDKNFGTFANDETKGYAKVEVKNNQGLLSIYCQNLKSSSAGEYRWYLINTETEGASTIVEIGTMGVDEKGKGDMACEFDAENVKDSMEQIDNFNVLALVVQNKEEGDKLYVPLVGYMDKKGSDAGLWRYALNKYLHIPLDERAAGEKTAQFCQPIEEIGEESIEKPPEEIIEKTIEEVAGKFADGDVEEIEIIEGAVRDKILEETAEKIMEEATEEILEKVEGETAEKVVGEKAKELAEEAMGEAVKEIMEEADKLKETMEQGATEAVKEAEKEVAEEIVEGTTEKVVEDAGKKVKIKCDGDMQGGLEIEQKSDSFAEAEEDEYEVQMQAYIENSLRGFQEIEPFVEGLENYTWWQIPYDTQTMYRAYMPFISYLDSLKRPMDNMDYYISRMLQIIYIHQHHIFGICYDENNKAKCYAYGILGRNLSLEQPFELDENFVYWHPCDNVPANIESYGYWILTIDPKTGDAVKIY